MKSDIKETPIQEQDLSKYKTLWEEFYDLHFTARGHRKAGQSHEAGSSLAFGKFCVERYVESQKWIDEAQHKIKTKLCKNCDKPCGGQVYCSEICQNYFEEHAEMDRVQEIEY